MAKAPKTGTAVASWREEAAAAAARAAEVEKNEGGGRFFSMKAGQLKFDDVALPGNMMAVVVVGVAHENVYYEAKYDPDNKTPPTCFAFWKETMDHDLDEMSPPATVDEEEVFERQSDYCKTCPQNEWGSAETGKGKACSNRRRLAVIPAGAYKSAGKNKGFDLEMFTEAEQFKKSDLAYLKLPVMSVKAYSAFVREVSEQLGKPLWAVFTNVSVVPDDRSQFKVEFELIDEVPDEFMDVIFKRHKEAMDEVDFPYRPPSDDDAPAEKQAAPKNNAAKKLAGGAAAKGRQKAKK
jgi:hypothetical protein